MPKIDPIMYSCPCGYSLQSAYGFLTQAEISRMLVSHIDSVHKEKR